MEGKGRRGERRGGERRGRRIEEEKQKKKKPTENKDTQEILFFSCFGPISNRYIKYFRAATEKDPVVSCHTCDYFTSQGQRELWGGEEVRHFPQEAFQALSLPLAGSTAVMSALCPARTSQPLMNRCGTVSSQHMP